MYLYSGAIFRDDFLKPRLHETSPGFFHRCWVLPRRVIINCYYFWSLLHVQCGDTRNKSSLFSIMCCCSAAAAAAAAAAAVD